MWAIDLDTMTWHNPTCTGRAPGQRYGHTVTVVDYKVYIFGGRGPSGLLHNDLWCLDVETWKWTLMPSTTAPPLARFNHAGVAVGNKIAYFGGWDGESAFNDLWVYDIGELSGAERQSHAAWSHTTRSPPLRSWPDLVETKGQGHATEAAAWALNGLDTRRAHDRAGWVGSNGARLPAVPARHSRVRHWLHDVDPP